MTKELGQLQKLNKILEKRTDDCGIEVREQRNDTGRDLVVTFIPVPVAILSVPEPLRSSDDDGCSSWDPSALEEVQVHV